MWQGLAEATLNIGFSVGFTWLLVRRGWGNAAVIGVAAGSVLPTVICGWCVLWRWAAKEIGTAEVTLFRETLLRPIAACLPMLFVGILIRWLIGPHFGDPQWMVCLTGMAITGLVGVAGVWMVALSHDEKVKVLSKLRRRQQGGARHKEAVA